MAAYPALKPRAGAPLPIQTHVQVQPVEAPKIDVMFVLDTTGSMGELIATAKEKIWSIASTMAAAQPAPELRMGLVAYRDRGDAYVTKRFDLNDDLDSMYATGQSHRRGLLARQTWRGS